MSSVDLSLVLVRVAVGGLLLGHGVGNLFGWFGGYGLDGTGAIFERLGFRPGRRYAALAGVVEVAAGAMVAVGLATQLAAAGVIGLMLTTIRTAHRGRGPWYFNGGWEYNLTLLVVALSLALSGPGAVSLDRLLGVARASVAWGMGALLVGLAGGAAALALRSPSREEA